MDNEGFNNTDSPVEDFDVVIPDFLRKKCIEENDGLLARDPDAPDDEDQLNDNALGTDE